MVKIAIMAQKTILIVDDHAAVRHILSSDLEKKGFKILTAGSGEKGLQIADSQKPDLILLDVMMPGMDGFQTCRRLKEKEHTKGIPIIMLTAKSQREDIMVGMQTGAISYMVKPIKFEAVFDRIVKILGPPESMDATAT